MSNGGYMVTAALVVAKDQRGKNHHIYRGGWIPWLNDEQRAHFLRHNLVVEVDAAPQPAPEPSGEPGDEVAKPKKVAPKEEWVRFGVSKGNSQAELEALTKDELVDLLGDF